MQDDKDQPVQDTGDNEEERNEATANDPVSQNPQGASHSEDEDAE